MKKVFLASDHAGYELKSALGAFLSEHGFVIEDLGPLNYEALDDYPDTIGPLARALADDKAAFGIAIGASGQGEAMVLNRTTGVRAAVYYGGSKDIITLSRQHNDANALSLGAKFLTQAEAKDAVQLWLTTDFSQEERHARRIAKLN